MPGRLPADYRVPGALVAAQDLPGAGKAQYASIERPLAGNSGSRGIPLTLENASVRLPRALHAILLSSCGAFCMLAGGGIACSATAAGPAVFAPAVAVAVVTDLTGRGKLHRNGQDGPLPILATLAPRDQLRLERGAVAELAFTAGTGSVLRLTGPGRFRVGEHDVKTRDAGALVERRDLAAALRNVQIRTGLIGRASIAMRGLPATRVGLRAPIGGVGAQTPLVLEWDPPYGGHSGAWNYAVRVIDDQGLLVYATEATGQNVALPESLPIERNRDYLWTVQARDADRRHAYGAAEFHRPAPEVEQRMVELTNVVAQARRDPELPESSAEEVLLAVVLEQAGLGDAAQRQLRALVPLRPALTRALAVRP